MVLKSSGTQLAILLLSVVIVFVVTNLFELEQYQVNGDVYLTNLLFYAVPPIAIFAGVLVSAKYRMKGKHGIAWILFTASMIFWYAAELTYDYEVEYDLQDISTLTSDIFWIIGYPLFFGFSIFYLIPFRKIISRKMISLSCITSVLLLVPILLIVNEHQIDLESLESFFNVLYPVLGSVLLVPALISVALFFKGKVSILWILMFLGILVEICADIGFLLIETENAYVPGNLIDVLFVSAYILYMYGPIHIYKIFNSEKLEKNSN